MKTNDHVDDANYDWAYWTNSPSKVSQQASLLNIGCIHQLMLVWGTFLHLFFACWSLKGEKMNEEKNSNRFSWASFGIPTQTWFNFIKFTQRTSKFISFWWKRGFHYSLKRETWKEWSKFILKEKICGTSIHICEKCTVERNWIWEKNEIVIIYSAFSIVNV